MHSILTFAVVDVLIYTKSASTDGWWIVLLGILEAIPPYTLVPRLILSLRKLYARDLQGRQSGFDGDTAFGSTLTSSHSSSASAIIFADVGWHSEFGEEIEMEEREIHDSTGSGAWWKSLCSRRLQYYWSNPALDTHLHNGYSCSWWCVPVLASAWLQSAGALKQGSLKSICVSCRRSSLIQPTLIWQGIASNVNHPADGSQYLPAIPLARETPVVLTIQDSMGKDGAFWQAIFSPRFVISLSRWLI